MFNHLTFVHRAVATAFVVAAIECPAVTRTATAQYGYAPLEMAGPICCDCQCGPCAGTQFEETAVRFGPFARFRLRLEPEGSPYVINAPRTIYRAPYAPGLGRAQYAAPPPVIFNGVQPFGQNLQGYPPCFGQ